MITRVLNKYLVKGSIVHAMLPDLSTLSLDPGVETGGYYSEVLMQNPVLSGYRAGKISFEEAMERLGKNEPQPRPPNDRARKAWVERGWIIATIEEEHDRRLKASRSSGKEIKPTAPVAPAAPKPVPAPAKQDAKRRASDLAGAARDEFRRRAAMPQPEPPPLEPSDSSDSFTTDGGDSPGRNSARKAGERLRPMMEEALKKHRQSAKDTPRLTNDSRPQQHSNANSSDQIYLNPHFFASKYKTKSNDTENVCSQLFGGV